MTHRLRMICLRLERDEVPVPGSPPPSVDPHHGLLLRAWSRLSARVTNSSAAARSSPTMVLLPVSGSLGPTAGLARTSARCCGATTRPCDARREVHCCTRVHRAVVMVKDGSPTNHNQPPFNFTTGWRHRHVPSARRHPEARRGMHGRQRGGPGAPPWRVRRGRAERAEH